MIPIISVVGRSDSGKTTLIEKLLAELASRGYNVGTVKHDVHGFDIDKPGKDSWRHSQAGSRLVAISSPDKVAVYEKVARELSLDEIVTRYFYDVDLILTEGFKREAKLKIEIMRGSKQELLSPRAQILFVASDIDVTDAKSDEPNIIDLNDPKKMVDIIEDKVLSRDIPQVSLYADGKKIPLNKIMKPMVLNTFLGLIASLKGVDDPQDISLRIHRRRQN